MMLPLQKTYRRVVTSDYSRKIIYVEHDIASSPARGLIYGSQGNAASCTAQGFFIQLGTVSSYMNVSLAVHYLLVIKYSWPENRIKKWRIGLFVCPVLVGLTFACAGIPFYDNMILWCNK